MTVTQRLFRVFMQDKQRGFVWARTVGEAKKEAAKRLNSTPTLVRRATNEEIHQYHGGFKGLSTRLVFDNEVRRVLKDKFWVWIEPSIERYSDQLEALLDTLTDEQLKKFVEARVEE